MTHESKTEKIRALNDKFRSTFSGGEVLLTPGIMDSFAAELDAILGIVRTYDAFDESNDPHGEHDFGSFAFRGRKIFWKIDYYDRGMEMGSSDPADPAQTVRVLTVLFASEW